MKMHERVERMVEMQRSGRLLRGRWTATDAAGRERACWLAALLPEAGAAASAAACPAEVMPAPLAHLVPWMDDFLSTKAWPGMTARFVGLAGRWRELDAAAWRRCDIAWRRAAVVEALRHVPPDEPWGVRSACVGGAGGGVGFGGFGGGGGGGGGGRPHRRGHPRRHRGGVRRS